MNLSFEYLMDQSEDFLLKCQTDLEVAFVKTFSISDKNEIRYVDAKSNKIITLRSGGNNEKAVSMFEEREHNLESSRDVNEIMPDCDCDKVSSLSLSNDS